MTAPASCGRQDGQWGSLEGKPTGTSDASLDLDAFLDSVVMRDPVRLDSELVPLALAQGLGLYNEVMQGQQGSNGRKEGSGNRLIAVAGGFGRVGTGGTPATNGVGVSGSVPAGGYGGGKTNGVDGVAGPAEPFANHEVGEPDADALAEKQAAAAGAAAAQAAYAHQQQQAANAMAAAAQVYSQQQAAYAQQTQQAATAAAAAAAAVAANHQHQLPITTYSRQLQATYLTQAQQAQAQQAAYYQAYQQQATAQAQAAAYVAATGQYPPGWMPSPYGYAHYYSPEPGGPSTQYMQAYQGMAPAPTNTMNMNMMPPSQPPNPARGGATQPNIPLAQQNQLGGPPLMHADGGPTSPDEADAAVAGDGGVDGHGFIQDDGDGTRAVKRPRLIWTQALHKRFLESVEKCGGLDHAQPKAIMKTMGVSGLTRENVASHMQKYRIRLKREEEHVGDEDEQILHKEVVAVVAEENIKDQPQHFVSSKAFNAAEQEKRETPQTRRNNNAVEVEDDGLMNVEVEGVEEANNEVVDAVNE